MAERLINPFAEGVPSRGILPIPQPKEPIQFGPPTKEEWEWFLSYVSEGPLFDDYDDEIADDE